MKIESLYEIFLQHPSVQTDTRKLVEGDLFFALKGENFNGNEYAQIALEKGASYAIIDEERFSIKNKTILVTDVLSTLQSLATHHRKQFSIPFLAITGSNGKTTTKELIHVVLSRKYKTYTTEGNLNNHIGVPLTLLKVGKDAEIAVIEMGANHQKEIASYCTIALPTHGLITNCGKAHLEGFGSEEGVRKGKGELFDYLREHSGTAFINSDYAYLKEMSKNIREIETYGTATADVSGSVIASDPFLKIQFTKGLQVKIETKLVGDYNASNVIAAGAVGKYFSIEEEKIKAAIESYSPTNSRSQLVQKGNNTFILDAYNANPSSMKAAIQNFAKLSLEDKGGKTLILGAMAELGMESIEEHKVIIEEIISNNVWKEVILVGGDFLKFEHPFLKFSSPEEAGKWMKDNHINNRLILIKGSRSTAMEKVLDFI